LVEGRSQPSEIDPEFSNEAGVEPATVFNLVIPPGVIRDALDDPVDGLLRCQDRLPVAGTAATLEQAQQGHWVRPLLFLGFGHHFSIACRLARQLSRRSSSL
jgi:hypothetical protein